MKLYKITNKITGKFYIGMTSRPDNQRQNNHLSFLRNGKHKNNHLQSSFNKHGEENFEFSTIAEGYEDVYTLAVAERDLIVSTECYKPEVGYNQSIPNPDTDGYIWSRDQREVFSEARKGATYRSGKAVSDISRENYSKAFTGMQRGDSIFKHVPSNTIYFKVKDAMEDLKMSRASIGNALMDKGIHREFFERVEAILIVRCVNTGQDFESYEHAAEVMGLSSGTIITSTHRGNKAGGLNFIKLYEVDGAEYRISPEFKTRFKLVDIDTGMCYDNSKQASYQTGYTHSVVIAQVKGKNTRPAKRFRKATDEDQKSF